MARRASLGRSPSADRVRRPASTWSLSPATRTWKNSSRPSEKMARNLTRSSSGTRSSSARSSSRAPNSSHDSSRFENRSGPRAVTASSAPTGVSVGVASATEGPGRAAVLAPRAGSEACMKHPGYRRWVPARVPGAGVGRRPGSRLQPVPRLLSRLAPTAGMRVRRPKPKRRTELGLLIFGSLIVVATYVLASVGTTSKIPTNLGPFLGVMLGLALVAHVANRIYAPDANAVLLPIATLLNGLGYVMLARIGQNWAQAQAGWTAVGVGAYVVTLAVVRRSRDLDRYRYLLLLAAVVLMLSPLIPHVGRNIRGARLWVGIGPVNGQPIELAKLALCVFFASYFVEKRELLSVPTLRVGNRLMLDPRPLVPILVAEHDIGFALLIFVLFMTMLWLTSGRWNYLVLGLILFLAGAFAADRLFTQVNVRV